MRSRLVLVTALVGLVAASGCPKKAPDKPLTVLCGGSFRPPLEELVETYRTEKKALIEVSFGQSEDLLPQVKLGSAGDVFVTHDPFLDYTKEAGKLADSAHVGFVAPVLVVSKGNPAGVESIEDLAKPGVKVALPNPEYSTCGEMLVALLEKKGIREQVEANAGGAVFRSHSETGNALKLGTREAGVMWNGTAHTFLDDIDVVPTEYEYDEVIKVWVMGLSDSEQPEKVADFVAFCREKGTEVFAKHGYVK